MRVRFPPQAPFYRQNGFFIGLDFRFCTTPVPLFEMYHPKNKKARIAPSPRRLFKFRQAFYSIEKSATCQLDVIHESPPFGYPPFCGQSKKSSECPFLPLSRLGLYRSTP